MDLVRVIIELPPSSIPCCHPCLSLKPSRIEITYVIHMTGKNGGRVLYAVTVSAFFLLEHRWPKSSAVTKWLQMAWKHGMRLKQSD